jgi:signal recognition particle GTPase
MQIGIDMLGTTDLETFLTNEMLKRALGMEDVYMTVHEEYSVLMQQLQNILKKETE